MTEVTKEQFELLDKIERSFSSTLVKKHFGGDTSAAWEAFAKNTGFGEKIGLIVAKLRFEFAKNAGYETRAKRLVACCDKAVPALTSTFGEQALVDALPVEARTKEIAELSDQLGASRVAALIRKSF